MDSSDFILKSMLLHNGNEKKLQLFLKYSVDVKNCMKVKNSEKFKTEPHKWEECGGMKVIN